jgi:hypothetical protein
MKEKTGIYVTTGKHWELENIITKETLVNVKEKKYLDDVLLSYLTGSVDAPTIEDRH